MKKNHYAVTEVDGVPCELVVEGFGAIAEMRDQGRKPRFRAFRTEEAARRYLKTGELYCGGHSHGGFTNTAVKAVRVDSTSPSARKASGSRKKGAGK